MLYGKGDIPLQYLQRIIQTVHLAKFSGIVTFEQFFVADDDFNIEILRQLPDNLVDEASRK